MRQQGKEGESGEAASKEDPLGPEARGGMACPESPVGGLAGTNTYISEDKCST